MREIKFRAWRESDKQMITENNMHSPRALYFNGKTFYTYEKMSTFGGGDGIRYKDNLILMQYTGLKDKNDVEIYEGDIINHNDFIGYVKYINKGNCNVLGYALVSLLNNRVFYMYCDETDNYEVIGNIYENPELLEEK